VLQFAKPNVQARAARAGTFIFEFSENVNFSKNGHTARFEHSPTIPIICIPPSTSTGTNMAPFLSIGLLASIIFPCAVL